LSTVSAPGFISSGKAWLTMGDTLGIRPGSADDPNFTSQSAKFRLWTPQFVKASG
jgi:hypothetical protein